MSTMTPSTCDCMLPGQTCTHNTPSCNEGAQQALTGTPHTCTYVCRYVSVHSALYKADLQEIQEEERPFVLQKKVFILEVAND